MKASRLIVNLVAAPVLLAACLGIASLMVSSREAPPIPPKQEVVITVSYTAIGPETIAPTIESFGTTQSYFSTNLSSQVGGEIIEVSKNFRAGNTVSEGEWLVKINPADYQANLANRKASLANAKQALAQEEIRSKLAKEDWIASGRPLSEATNLTLRKPQLESAKATVESAEASVMQAQLDLERATISAPFDAIVENRMASPGNILTRGASLGSLIARNNIQVRLPITPRQAAQIELPKFGNTANTLKASLNAPSLPGSMWTASLNRMEPTIDPRNQSIYLIGEISDPFENPNAFLPVGAFVEAKIKGKALENVYQFKDSAVVDDAYVWVVSEDDTLAKQEIEIVFSERGQVLARMDASLSDQPLKVLDLPLASLKPGQKVKPVASAQNS